VVGVLLSFTCWLVLAEWLVPARRYALLATHSQDEANLAAQGLWHSIDQRGREQTRAHRYVAGNGGSVYGKRAVLAAAAGSMGGGGLLGLASSALGGAGSTLGSKHSRKAYYSSSALGAPKWDANGTK
jgi:hypothetical protein